MTCKNTIGVVRFALKDSYTSLKLNPEKESLINLHFSHSGRRFKKSTKFKASLKNWNANKQRVKTGKGQPGNAYKINAYLNKLESFVDKRYNELVETGMFSLKTLSGEIEGFLSGEMGKLKNKGLLVPYCVEVLKSKEQTIAQTTKRSYSQTIINLQRYQKAIELTPYAF